MAMCSLVIASQHVFNVVCPAVHVVNHAIQAVHPSLEASVPNIKDHSNCKNNEQQYPKGHRKEECVHGQ